jgi:hypothetical protein
MRLFVLAFTGGVWLLQQQAALPVLSVLVGLAGAAVVLLFLSLRLQRPALGLRRFPGTAALLSAAALGFVWAAGFAHLRLAEELPAAIEGKDIELTGVVAGLPQALERGVRFEFDVEQAPTGVPPHISLAWYRSPEAEDEDASPLIPVRAGERWRFTVRLKRPHGNLNPHGFDYEAWLFERGIRATGYVRPRRTERLDAAVWQSGYAVEMLREKLRDRFRAALPEAPYAGILIALAIGDQHAIDADLWLSFARTGITHLMSISGLHVTMLAGLAYALVNWLWRRSARLPLRLPAQHAAAVGGFIAAFLYCLLAGFRGPCAAHALHARRGRRRPALGARGRGVAGAVAGLDAGAAARPVGGSCRRLLALVRRRGAAVPDRQRAPGAGALAGRMGARAMGRDAGPVAGAAGPVPAIFTGLAAGQCPGDSAGELRHHAAGPARRPASARPAAVARTFFHHRPDGLRRLACGLAAGGLAAGGTAGLVSAAGAPGRCLAAAATRFSVALAGPVGFPAAADS